MDDDEYIDQRDVEEHIGPEAVTIISPVTISKTNDEKRYVFGWASVATVDDKKVVDRQGDMFKTIDDLESAAYDYVSSSGVGGMLHIRQGVSRCIESFVLTDEKAEAMGMPKPYIQGWWVGFHVHDDVTWSKIKSGEFDSFSIGGKAQRKKLIGHGETK